MNTPQVHVTLSSEGELQMEQTLHGVRRITALPMATAGQRLRQALLAQQRKLEGEQARARVPKGQPDWLVIAEHPQAIIREMLPGRGVAGGTSKKTVEDLGL